MRATVLEWNIRANRGRATQANPDTPLNKLIGPSLIMVLLKQCMALLYLLHVCKRTLTVSKGYPTTSEHNPPKPPAIKFAFGLNLVLASILAAAFGS